MDKYLTKQQIQKLIDEAPTSIPTEEIIQGLTERGYTLEGLEQPKQITQPEKKAGILQEGGAVQQLGIGIAKGALSTIKGIGQLGEMILPPAPAFGSVYSDEATKGKLLDEKNLEAQGTMEKIGKFGEQVAEFAIPASKIAKATKTLPFLAKTATRALGSGAVATAQEGEIGKGTGIAVGTEVALPVVGKYLVKPATKILTSLFKGLGSGVSGVGTDILEQIAKNPQSAENTIKELAKDGNFGVLKKNAETIVNGVSKIKGEARSAFGQGLETLKQTDIDDKIFRSSTQSILDKYGSVLKNGKRQLTNIEFDDPKNIKKANDLITKLQGAKLDGKSLRKLVDDIENSAYKIATTDERLSFNTFVKDLANSLKSGISKSTPKLDEINKAFSKDMQLAESIEQIFGKVKFKNAQEVNKVAQQLETLFSKKGLSPEYIDDFLNRIGVSPEKFKTSEAVRQIGNKTTGANTKGLSIGEITQQITSSVITPKLVRDIAIKTGKSEQVIKTLLENTAPTARAILIETLIPTK